MEFVQDSRRAGRSSRIVLSSATVHTPNKCFASEQYDASILLTQHNSTQRS